MNLFKRSCSVFLLCALLFAQFSTLCYASETVTSSVYSLRDNSVSTFSVTDDDVANGLVQADFLFRSQESYTNRYLSNPFTWQSPMELPVFSFSSSYSNIDDFNNGIYSSGLRMYVRFSAVDGSPVIEEGESASLKVTGLKHQMKYNYHWSYSASNSGGSGGGVAYYPLDASQISKVIIQFANASGNQRFTTYSGSELDDMLLINGDTFGIEKNIEVPFDTTRIDVVFFWSLDAYNWSVPDASGNHKYAVHEYGTGIYFESAIYNGVLKISPPDENSGLLRSIIEWLRNIRDGITNVFESITALPGRIWSFIEEGLKSLLVPSADDIVAMKDQWDTLLSDRFGVVYQSGTLIIDTVKTITAQAGNPNIEFPQVSYNFSGTDVTFGGYNVQVVPTGFEFLADILKTVIDIVVTLAFVNGMRNKYDELMMR